MPLTTTSLLLIGGAAGVALALAALALRRSAHAASESQRVAAILAVARRYALGDLSRPAPDYGDDQLGSVARGMDQAVQELGRRVDSLARDRARMEAILSSMIEGVLVVDEQGRLQLDNDAARRILKLEQDAIDRPYVDAVTRASSTTSAGCWRAATPARLNSQSRATPPGPSSPRWPPSSPPAVAPCW